MKELVIAACTALVAGAALGGTLKLPDMTSPQAADTQILPGEDPNMALHRVVMGSNSWTAPETYVRAAAASPAPTTTADAELVAWQARSHAENEAARQDYLRDAEAFAYRPEPAAAQEPPAASANLVSLDSAAPRG